MINKIVYFTLTSAAEAPVGFVIRKAGLPPLFFFLYFVFFFFSLPLLAQLTPLWWSCGSSEGYHPNTKHHGKSKLWLFSGDGPCRLGGSCRVRILRSAVTLSGKKVEWNPLVFTSHQIASPPSFRHQNVCFTKKVQGLVKLQGGWKTNDLIQALHVLLSTPTSRKSDGVMMSARSDWTGRCCLCWIRLIYDLGGEFGHFHVLLMHGQWSPCCRW